MEGDRLTSKNTKESDDVRAKPKEILGLSTTVALDTLHRDVERVLQEYEEDHRRNKYSNCDYVEQTNWYSVRRLMFVLICDQYSHYDNYT